MKWGRDDAGEVPGRTIAESDWREMAGAVLGDGTPKSRARAWQRAVNVLAERKFIRRDKGRIGLA